MSVRRRKEVVVHCHGPIACHRENRSPWVDVRIRLKAKPGRRIYRFAPCLVSRSYLERELEWERETHGRPLRVPPWLEWEGRDRGAPMDNSEEIAALETALSRIDAGTVFVEVEGVLGLEDVCTPTPYIDRAEAERMLDVYLAAKGFPAPKRYRWKRPPYVVIPT